MTACNGGAWTRQNLLDCEKLFSTYLQDTQQTSDSKSGSALVNEVTKALAAVKNLSFTSVGAVLAALQATPSKDARGIYIVHDW